MSVMMTCNTPETRIVPTLEHIITHVMYELIMNAVDVTKFQRRKRKEMFCTVDCN